MMKIHFCHASCPFVSDAYNVHKREKKKCVHVCVCLLIYTFYGTF